MSDPRRALHPFPPLTPGLRPGSGSDPALIQS